MVVLNSKDIPDFIKAFKKDFFCYILNIDYINAERLLKDKVELSKEQSNVLDEVIEKCRSHRELFFDQHDPNFMFYFTLRLGFINNERHIFNIWRDKSGGCFPRIKEDDSLIYSIQKLGIDAYPAYLINEESFGHMICKVHISRDHKLAKQVREEILKDNKLRILFKIQDNNEPLCSFVSSNGLLTTISIDDFIDNILLNSYYLMLFNGKNQIDDYLNQITFNIRLLRILAEKKIVKVPVFTGYSNISFPSNVIIDTELGQIESFYDSLKLIIPKSIFLHEFDKKKYSIVHKCLQNYSIILPSKEKNNYTWPKELKENRFILDKIDEDLKLAISLTLTKHQVISLEKSWVFNYDPLFPSSIHPFKSDSIKESKIHSCAHSDTDKIKYWINKIYELDDTKIRIAIRKTLSSMYLRQNPVDAFIDGIIAWENLFGGKSKKSHEIATEIAYLLEREKAKRKEMISKLKYHYRMRNKVVHGIKEIENEEATMLRNYVIKLILRCFTELYENNSLLVDSAGKSRLIYN